MNLVWAIRVIVVLSWALPAVILGFGAWSLVLIGRETARVNARWAELNKEGR